MGMVWSVDLVYRSREKRVTPCSKEKRLRFAISVAIRNLARFAGAKNVAERKNELQLVDWEEFHTDFCDCMH